MQWDQHNHHHAITGYYGTTRDFVITYTVPQRANTLDIDMRSSNLMVK